MCVCVCCVCRTSAQFFVSQQYLLFVVVVGFFFFLQLYVQQRTTKITIHDKLASNHNFHLYKTCTTTNTAFLQYTDDRSHRHPLGTNNQG